MSEGIILDFSLSFAAFSLQARLSLPSRGVTALFGHSGSGKTTLLRCMAGLQKAHGFLSVNGQVWQDDAQKFFLPTHQRPLAYVFQEACLFDHLSVQKNLEYGYKRIPEAERKITFDHAVALLGIGNLLNRQPDRLSGGERQRVAIARALLTSPQLLLMDEPLASLDLKRKQEILPYLERLHDELAIPFVYVSHSPDEVARLADYLVLLDQGHIVASGPLQTTLARLDLPATFADDAGVVIQAVIGEHDVDTHLSRLDFAGGALFVGRRVAEVGVKKRCRIHARDVSITLEKQVDTSILNHIPAIVTGMAATDHPANILVQLDAQGTPLLARITVRSSQYLELVPGKPVWAQIKAVALLD